jgi:hypothetical protein
MTDDPTKAALAALDALLEAERTALMNGDLEALADLLPEKEAQIAILNASEQQQLSELKELDVKVRRNQLLLNGALEGIRSVARRMAEMRQLRGSLDTYNSAGEKRSIEVATKHSLEKRA